MISEWNYHGQWSFKATNEILLLIEWLIHPSVGLCIFFIRWLSAICSAVFFCLSCIVMFLCWWCLYTTWKPAKSESIKTTLLLEWSWKFWREEEAQNRDNYYKPRAFNCERFSYFLSSIQSIGNHLLIVT